MMNKIIEKLKNKKVEISVDLMPKYSLAELEDVSLMGRLLQSVKETAKALGITDYRTIINTGAGAGQTVFHLHIHILSGKNLKEKL